MIQIRHLALLLAGAALGGRAWASGESEEAEISFRLALEAYTAGEYDLALSRFLTSNRLAPNPAVAFNVARCYARTSRYAEAYRWYRIASEGLTDKATLRAVQEGLAAITPQVVVFDLTSSPPGATVYADSKDLGAIGVTPLQVALPPASSRTFVFEKAGFSDAVRTGIRGSRGETVEVEADLRQIVGSVLIGGTEDAEVHLGTPDGPVLCTTPCEATLEPGARVLYLTREGFRDGILQLEIVADEHRETAITLQPKTGSILVDASEAGAMVEVDGNAVGFTPTVVQGVAVGERVVRITRPGFSPVERTVEVETDAQLEVTGVDLVPLNEVTAVSRRAEQVSLAPSSVTILSRAELEAFRYPTIYEALRGVRGLALTYDSIYGSAAVRGLGQANDFGNRLLILSDGAILNDNILYQSFISYDGRSDLSGVEQIEVVRGPGSILYGTGAVSGVVNLVGEPRDVPNGLELGVGAFENVFNGTAQLHYSKGAFGIRASGGAAASPGRVETVDPRGDDPPLAVTGFDQFESGSTTGRIWFGEGTLQWYHSKRKLHIPTGVYDTTLNDPKDNYWVDQLSTAELRYEPGLSPRTRLLTRVYGNRYQYDGVLPYDADGYTSVERYIGLALGAEARVITEPSDVFRLQTGIQGNASPILTLTGEDRLDDGTVAPYMDESEAYGIGAVYALADLTPVEQVRLTLGSRVDYWSTFGLAVSPRAAAVLVPDEGDVIKLMAGRAFRAPSVFELVYNIPSAQVRPDFDGTVLLPETVWSAEVEYSHAFDEMWTGLVALHGSQAISLIETVQAPGLEEGVVTYRNSDLQIRIAGADLELRRAFQGGYMFSAFYSLLDSRYEDGSLVPNAPQHNAAFKVILPVARPMARLALRTSLEAPRRIDSTREDATGLAVVMDAVISGTVPDLGFEYAVGVYNLLDSGYSQPLTDTFPFRTMPQAGRSLMANLSKSF